MRRPINGHEAFNRVKVGPWADKPEYDEVGAIIRYEQGELSYEEHLELFQHLVDNGHAWTLQSCYGREAARLLANDEITNL